MPLRRHKSRPGLLEGREIFRTYGVRPLAVEEGIECAFVTFEDRMELESLGWTYNATNHTWEFPS